MNYSVKDIANMTIIIDNWIPFSFNINEKNARSGITVSFCETAIRPENPIKKTIGRMIIKEKIKLFFNTSLFFAAYTLCQLPWWNKFVAATAIKKVNPAVKLGK